MGLLIAAAVRRRNGADPNTATNKTLAVDERVTVDSGEKKRREGNRNKGRVEQESGAVCRNGAY